MQLCSRCVLPETFPGIRFDSGGVCNFCSEYQAHDGHEKKKREYHDRFEKLLEQHRGKSTYDVIMGYSGGKDSTYTLKLLHERYGLKILAVTFDNGFIPERTFINIRNVSESLAIDHLLFKPRFDLLKLLFREGAVRSMYPPKTLERASTICTTCMGIVKFSLLRLAIEKRIPFIAFGWSPGQAPITSAIMKNNPSLVRLMQNALYEPMRALAGDDIRPYFLETYHFEGGHPFPYNISPLAFFDYSEDNIMKEISSLGWEAPKDTDSNSTNCLLNSFANIVHKRQFHFHPYAFEVAGLVRTGVMTREEGLAKISAMEEAGTVARVMERLGIIEEEAASVSSHGAIFSSTGK